MTKDDLDYLCSIAKTLGNKHFSVTAMHKAVYPNRHRAWAVIDQDKLKKIMSRLVRDEFAIESEGVRGGAGWTLTNAGINVAAKH